MSSSFQLLPHKISPISPCVSVSPAPLVRHSPTIARSLPTLHTLAWVLLNRVSFFNQTPLKILQRAQFRAPGKISPPGRARPAQRNGLPATSTGQDIPPSASPSVGDPLHLPPFPDLISPTAIRPLYCPGLPFRTPRFRTFMQKPPHFMQGFWEYGKYAGFRPNGACCMAL